MPLKWQRGAKWEGTGSLLAHGIPRLCGRTHPMSVGIFFHKQQTDNTVLLRARKKAGFERQNWKLNRDLALDLSATPPKAGAGWGGHLW